MFDVMIVWRSEKYEILWNMKCTSSVSRDHAWMTDGKYYCMATDRIHGLMLYILYCCFVI